MSRHSQISRCAPIGLKNFSKLDDAEKLTKSIYILNIVNELKKFFFLLNILYTRQRLTTWVLINY